MMGADKPFLKRYMTVTSIVSAGWRLRAAAGRPAAFLLGFEAGLRGKTQEDRLLLELLDPVAEAAGYALVRLRLMGGAGKARRLQIMGEDSGGEMTVEDCARLSRAISDVLDAADPIEGAYRLEISSPGLDRPLVRRSDFERHEGAEVKVELAAPFDGRRRFRGVLAGVEGAAARVRNVDRPDGGDDVLLPFDDMADAKLVLTDELIAASLRRSKSDEPAGRRPGDARPRYDHRSRQTMKNRRASGNSPAAPQTEGE